MKAKWKNLCDSYKKCLDREREISKSGSGARKTPTCRYYKQLSFLRNVVTNRQTISNVILPAFLMSQPCPGLHPLHHPLRQIAVTMLTICILQSLVLKKSAGKQAPLSKERLAQQNATKEQLLRIQSKVF